MTRKLSWKSGVFLTVVLSAVHTIQGSFFDYSDNTVYENEPNDDELLAAPYEDSDSDQTNQAYILPVSKPVGQVTGLGINSQGQLLAFHRAERVWNQWSFDEQNRFNASAGPIKNATIYLIDQRSGKVVDEFGKSTFYMPHGLTVDSSDNIWVTDVALHQVLKYDKNFKMLMKLGEALKPGSDNKHFCKPTDVAVASNGHFFVADGYCNSRVMKFDEHGKLLAKFGSSNGGDGAEDGEFWIPHSLALIEDMNLICVADRENERIQCFSAGLTDDGRALPTGILITKAESIGRVFAIREKKHYLVGVTGSDSEGIEPQLFVMDMNSGKASSFVKGIENAHCLTISDDGTVYVGQVGPNQIVELSLLDQK